MEVTALKGSSGDVQHFADRIIAERGVRYGHVAMIPKRRPNAHLTSETPVVACPCRVKRQWEARPAAGLWRTGRRARLQIGICKEYRVRSGKGIKKRRYPSAP